MSRKKRQAPEIDQVTGLWDSGINYAFLRGHLVVESVLIEALRAQLAHPEAMKIDESSFNYNRLVGTCRALGMISKEMYDFLNKIGALRNKMAHVFHYELTFDEMFDLAKTAASAGVDFSDQTIFKDQQRSQKWYGAESIVQEIFQNAVQDLVYQFDPNLDGPFAEFFSPPADYNSELT